jgi:outer membrane protein TolC
MKKIIIIALVLFLVTNLYSQQKITLEECFESAIVHHPIYAQKALQLEKSELEKEQFRKDLLPQFTMSGRASYQSEVISLPIEMPQLDIPELSKDQYRLALDINQAIYRGGIYQKQRELENLDQILQQLEVDKNLYNIKNDVKTLFFSIILLDHQKKIVLTYQDRVTAKLKEIESLVEEGVALQSSADRLKVEQLSISQQLKEIAIQRLALINNLEQLTKMELSGTTELIVSSVEIDDNDQQRLEFQYLMAAQRKLEFSKELIDARKLPMVSAFATGGYGRPGYNYLSDQFSEFWMVGINLQWKILNWNRFNDQKKVLDLNINMIETQKDDFELTINMALNKMMAEIEKTENLLKDDPEMIRLRKSIAENASNELNQGVITSSAYIDELQLLSQAEINMKIHEIQLINSKMDYLNILGKL